MSAASSRTSAPVNMPSCSARKASCSRGASSRRVATTARHARPVAAMRRRDEPPIRTGSRADLEALLREPPPEEPGDVDAALDLLAGQVLAHMQHGDHPRFYARVPSPSNAVGALGDALAAGFNAIATS